MIMCAEHHCNIDLCGCDADDQYRRAQEGPEPNYKALYTELKGEVLEKVGPFAECGRRLWNEAREEEAVMLQDFCGTLKHEITNLHVTDFRALSSLHEKLSSIEVFPELPSGDVSTHAAGEGEDVCPDCGLDWCGATCGRWPKGSVDA